MHVLLISACVKRSIKRTRAVLDSYALRTGDTSWASAITSEALCELRMALKRGATRQTAVACYQNDGRRRMKLLWVVGARSAFGDDGHFPAGTKQRKEQKPKVSSGHWSRQACMLAGAAGLVHDLGKASLRFDAKLRTSSGPVVSDDVRHEWLSVKVLQAMRNNGRSWDGAWADLGAAIDPVTLGSRVVQKPGMYGLHGPLEAIDFLVVTHHGLLRAEETVDKTPKPVPPTSADRHVRRPPSTDQVTPKGGVHPTIFKDYWALEAKLQAAAADRSPLYWRALSIIARAALIFADHTVSSQRMPAAGLDPDGSQIFANTAMFSGQRGLNQTLDWHLRHVGDSASAVMWHFAGLVAGDAHEQQLHGLAEETVASIVREAGPAYAWQNRCAAALHEAREASPDAPALVFNMAGTGTGKTRMNARAACLLSRRRTPRFSIALNLRSLTLQTGRALQSSLCLTDDEIAVVIGDRITQELFEKSNDRKSRKEPPPIDDDENPPEPEASLQAGEHSLPEWMTPLFQKKKERAIVGSPLLVSTIDFLGAAGTPGAQGHHVKAILRLMSSDLVLDEIDGYEPEALVAVLRLVQLAAMFRRNVICSSATLSMPTAVAIERAFRTGVAMLEALEGQAAKPQKFHEAQVAAPFICAFIDDSCQPLVHLITQGSIDFATLYQQRLLSVSAGALSIPVYRLAGLQRVVEATEAGWVQCVRDSIDRMHAHHGWEFGLSGKRVSFGLVRVANLGTAMLVAKHLSATMPDAQIACYHSAEFRIARFHKEQRLDQLLSRSRGEDHILADEEIVKLVARASGNDVPFIVVATPVEEIGRDHDFDWGVIEPSSTQSIVQTSGRINRHRLRVMAEQPNVMILQFNLRHCRTGADKPAFVHPGYESTLKRSRAATSRAQGNYLGHDMERLLPWRNDLLAVNARLRFDWIECPFALADDIEIEERVRPFFGESGVFVADSAWAMTDGPSGPYMQSSLRGGATAKQTWRLHDGGGGLEFQRLERRASDGAYRVIDTWEHRDMDQRLAHANCNAWLSSPPNRMLELCEEFNVEPDEGMLVELSVFDQETQFVYDHRFGMDRLPKEKTSAK